MTVPRWALASAIAAPVAMIGGWTLAAARQPSFDPAQETISALAASTATDPWIMTTGLAITGVAHLVTAAGCDRSPAAPACCTRSAAPPRSPSPLLPVDAAPRAHGVAAGIGFAALALWPAIGRAPRRDRRPAAGRHRRRVGGARGAARLVRRRAAGRRRPDRPVRTGPGRRSGGLAAGGRRRPASQLRDRCRVRTSNAESHPS